LEAKARSLVEGNVCGEAIVVDSLSFFGEVDPEKGVLRDGRSIAGKILVIGRVRGSTVGAYVIYGLRYYGRAPKAIVVRGDADPIVVAGAVLARIPLYDRLGDSLTITDGARVCVGDGTVRVYR